MQNIRNIWPTVKDISDDLGVPYSTVHSWVSRGRIPSDYDFDLISAAKKRGATLTLEELATARRGGVTQNAFHPTPNGAATPTNQPPATKRKRGGRG